jgi:D-alanyl-D-alanine endopeptidase (penicillin-binding protein 7)
MIELLKFLIFGLIFIISSFPEPPYNAPFNSLIYLPDLTILKEKLISQKVDFLELNLEESRVKMYKGGVFKKSFKILAKGNPDAWGGTPAGLYSVLSKHRLSYSNILDIYMPWSIHFYGKYYIHGEPHFKNGNKLTFSSSGGCIRLKDNSAKELYNLIEKGISVLVIDKTNDQNFTIKELLQEPPQISAQSYLVGDLDSGYIFTQKNYTQVLPIGSLTHFMTAVVVVENVDLRREILVTKNMLKWQKSPKRLTIGEKYGVVELLYPMLIESSNNSAEALAHFLGRDKTISLMNQKAKAIMMKKTKFIDPAGKDKNNVSTAKDLFYLARYILNNRSPILSITKGESVNFAGRFKNIKFKNENLFYDKKNFIGGKVGFIPAFGEVGLFIFKLQSKTSQKNVVIIILGGDGLKKDAEKLLAWLDDIFAK